jgi:hypothetical protein
LRIPADRLIYAFPIYGLEQRGNFVPDDWRAAWAPVLAQVGQVFPQTAMPGPMIERGALWRYLESLEFDCPLHYEVEAAHRAGFTDLVVPATAMLSFSLPSAWVPGEPFFVSSDRNAPSARSAVSGPCTGSEPPVEGFFASAYEAEYLGSATVGDTLCRKGARLLGCELKETRVGRGAFLTWESEIRNQRDEVVARQRMTYFRYEPTARGRS